MMENDPLKNVLKEWRAPEPGGALDQRVRAAYRESYRPSPWKQFWMTRISIPAPALAVLAIVVVALILQFRSAPAPVATRADRGYETRMEATGFQPLPNGAARVVPVEGVRQ
jgi:hypothetical protein